MLAVIAIPLSVATPILKTAHNNANETVVAREMQTIHQAQVQYLSQFGDHAATLAELGPPASGPGGPKAAKLIPASLAWGTQPATAASSEMK